MTACESRRVSLASAIADGVRIDWEEILRDAELAADPELVEHLRALERVARLHRELQQEPGAAPRKPPAGPVVPFRWGTLDVQERIGSGAFGDVFRARDTRLGREVALKLLHPGLSSHPGHAELMLHEARLFARVAHPNVVTVHGAEKHDGRVGFWMEIVQGRTLSRFLEEEGPLAAEEAARIAIELCHALAALHHAGLVHRDVKASNVMRAAGGRIVLMDLGAGTVLSPGAPPAAPVSGTPLYMAPELLRGEATTPRADLYALGVLLYHMATGDFPVRGATLAEIRGAHVASGPRHLRDQRPDLPDWFVAIVERALAADPAQRFASAGEMEQALRSGALAGALPAPAAAPARYGGWAAPALDGDAARWAILALALAGVVTALAALIALAVHALE
ncbi:MAG: serine/threonine protein kinase [Acidobacteria bacterium]|nr:serine/threonine protein kinase [Acidobacteriota bacterium]